MFRLPYKLVPKRCIFRTGHMPTKEFATVSTYTPRLTTGVIKSIKNKKREFCRLADKNYLGSQGYAPEDIPNPYFQPSLYSLHPHSTIIDLDNYLNASVGSAIENRILKITTAKVAVLIIRKMRAPHNGADAFAISVHNQWGLGDSLIQNGVLVFVSVEDRDVYISTGSGVQQRLNVAAIDAITDKMTNDLKSGQYGNAIMIAIEEIGTTMDAMNDTSKTLIGIGCFFAVVGFAIMCATQPPPEDIKEGVVAMTEYVAVLASAQSPVFSNSVCPHCLVKKCTSAATFGDNFDDDRAFHCGHKLCARCDKSKVGLSGECPICHSRASEDAAIAVDENTGITLFRTADILYRLKRFRHLFPKTLPEETSIEVERAVSIGNFRAAKQVLQLRVVQVQDVLDKQEAEREEAARKSRADHLVNETIKSQYGGGSASGGSGKSW